MPDIKQAAAALAAASFIMFPKASAPGHDAVTTGEIPAVTTGEMQAVTTDYVFSDVSGPGTGGSGGPRLRTRAQRAIAFARRQIGKPYIWGGTGPRGFDCSGLTMEAWRHAGVHIPRTSEAQLARLKRIPLRKLRAGDILVFLGGAHVALYIGHNRLIVAPQTGEKIQEAKFEGWYRETFTAVVRPW